MIGVENLTVDYFGNTALDSVTMDIPFGSSIGIIGPNGAGKSTFIKAILEVIPKSSGRITIDGENINKHKKSIAYVPQKSDVDLTFPITVKEAVLTGTFPNLRLFQRPGKKEKQIARKAMELVDITDLENKQINNLSGGQLQRVFIARALAQESDIFFLDEPFVGIDLVSERIIVDILKKLRAEGKTVLVVHHDLHEVQEYFDKLIILNKKLITFGDVAKVFNTENINLAYGDSMGYIEIKGLGD